MATSSARRTRDHLMNQTWIPNHPQTCTAVGLTVNLPSLSPSPGSKRARIISDSNNDTCSESPPPNSPPMKHHSGQLSPLRSTDNNLGSSSSDLDVDSTPDMDTPENLSVKKDDSISPSDTVSPPPPMTTTLDNISLLRHYSKDYHANNFLMGSHKKMPSPREEDRHSPPRNTSISPQPHPLGMMVNKPSTSPNSQRSPIDLLLRVFPNQKRNEVENLLQRNRGNIIQTMEALIYGDETNNSLR